MGQILNWIKNKEPLKISITDYGEGELSLIHSSDEYWIKHWEIFKRKKDKKIISKRKFNERMYNYLWIQKISELIIILYLENSKNNYPTIYEMNKLLGRTSKQYSITFKAVKKLELLNIIKLKDVQNSNRKEREISIDKVITKIYGEDEFRQMMLDEWNTDAKEYILKRLNYIINDKKKIETKIRLNKKGKRVK